MATVEDRMASDETAVAPYHKVFDKALSEAVVASLRSVIEQTLARRSALAEGETDKKWWVSLEELRKHAGNDPIQDILKLVVGSPAIQAAMSAVGDGPVAVLQYCIFRRFEPTRNPLPAHWHYDANILGLGTRMINTWLPLVDVGETAPGITLVDGPRRPAALWQRMVDLADADGMFTAETKSSTLFEDEEVVEAVAADPQADFVTPAVPAGGAISFDQLFLHRTQRLTPDMGIRDSFEFRVMSEKVARETGLSQRFTMVHLR